MKISYKWLTQYVKIDCPLDTLCDKLTMAGIEVEAVEAQQLVPAGVVVGKILERKAHPNADTLSVCKVFDGSNEIQIVCGAPNCDAGNTIALATIGTVFQDGEGEFKIKKSKLRGVESFGMMCSGKELGLNEDHDGLMILDNQLKAGTPLNEIVRGDAMITVEVTPNRADWLSHWGIARDVACLLDSPVSLPEIKPIQFKGKADKNMISVLDQELCPKYTARVIRNVKVAESPKWLKEKLLGIGLRPINNIVDITNYVMMELGQPLHAFDLDKLAGGKIIVRRAGENEKLIALNGDELTLGNRHLVIADGEKPVALAGVMGGEFSGVGSETRDILLESACFFSSNIRATSRELGISSDASYRYERGIDWDMVEIASDRAVNLILELAGGYVEGERLEIAKPAPALKHIFCRFERIRSLIGCEISNQKIENILRKLHLNVGNVTADSCDVVVPRFRLDLDREADLAEEVARINGLNNIPEVTVQAKAVSSITADAYYKLEELNNQLIACGLYQCMNYSLVEESKALSDLRFEAADIIRISNPLSLELECMRPSLWGGMLESVERNISRRNTSFRLFECGRVFCANRNKFPEERNEFCIMLSGCRNPERFGAELKSEYDFYDLKGILENLCEMRHLENVFFEAAEDPRFVHGSCAALKVDGKIIGTFGEIMPRLTKGFKTSHKIFGASMEVNALFAAERKTPLYYKSFSMFPATARDVTFVTGSEMEHCQVMKFIRGRNIKFLESATLCDVFEDEKLIGAGRKSMSYSFKFRNPERTLTDDEVNNTFEKLRKSLAEGLKVELR